MSKRSILKQLLEYPKFYSLHLVNTHTHPKTELCKTKELKACGSRTVHVFSLALHACIRSRSSSMQWDCPYSPLAMKILRVSYASLSTGNIMALENITTVWLSCHHEDPSTKNHLQQPSNCSYFPFLLLASGDMSSFVGAVSVQYVLFFRSRHHCRISNVGNDAVL